MARLPFSSFKQGKAEYEVCDAEARSDISALSSNLNKKLNKSSIVKMSKTVGPWAQSSNYAYAVQFTHNFGNANHQTFCTVNDAYGNTINCISVAKGDNIDTVYIAFKEVQTGNRTFDILAII